MAPRTARLAFVLAGTAACIGPGGLLSPRSPHAAYVAMLERSGRADSVDGRRWLDAAETVLRDAVGAVPPFRRTGGLGTATSSDAPALAYRVAVPRGRRLSIAVAFDAAPLFVDLFRVRPGEAPEPVASLAPGRRSLIHDIDEPGDYVVRAQSELGASGQATLAVRTLASLPFPVADVERWMQSGFGVARDAGRRQHQGIDIFAPRGTPVRAVTGGIARAGRNRLGGTVVWVYAPAQGRTFYYAHLDRHAIDAVTLVAAGHVLGYVGNSGNARTTPPHLHFGIYDDGAIDPWPFVQPDQAVPGQSGHDRAGPDRPGPDQAGPDRSGRPDRPSRQVSSRDRPRRRPSHRRRA